MLFLHHLGWFQDSSKKGDIVKIYINIYKIYKKNELLVSLVAVVLVFKLLYK